LTGLAAVGVVIASVAWAEAPDDGPPPTAESVQVGGYAQVDYLRRQISQDELSDGTGEPLNEDGFSVRRARVILGKEWKHVGVGSITELFGEGGVVRPVGLDVHAQIPSQTEDEPPVVQVRAGLFPVPFGFETYEQTDDARFFGERSLVAHSLVPGRFDLGAALSGRVWAIDWIVAVQNGEPLESGPYAYADPNAAKDVCARLRVSGDLIGSVRSAVGTSVLQGQGFSAGTPPTKDSFEWQDLNEDGLVLQSELIPIPGAAGRPSENFRRWGLGADVQVWAEVPKLGELLVYGEFAVAVNLDRAVAPADPVLLGRDQRSVGFIVAATQEITKAVTAGLRYDRYAPNLDALELFDGVTVVSRRPFRTVTAGVALNHALSERASAKLLTEGVFEQNSLGRDNRGRPAPIDNDTLRVRLQVIL